MRVGIADHLGWAVAVTATGDGEVVDRRRIELMEPGLPGAPIHYRRGRLDLEAMRELVAEARAAASRMTSAALDDLATALPEPIALIVLRAWPDDFPSDLAVQLQPPWESRADAVMYRRVLAELARARGWEVALYRAKEVRGEAAALLGDRADDVIQGPRAILGPPWTKDHGVALAATIVAGGGRGSPRRDA